MKERLEGSRQIVSANKLAAAATAERATRNVTYEPAPHRDRAVEKGAAGLAGGARRRLTKSANTRRQGVGKAEEPKKKRRFGFGRWSRRPAGGEKKSSETTGRRRPRGVDPERNAKGGGNPAVVLVPSPRPTSRRSRRKAN